MTEHTLGHTWPGFTREVEQLGATRVVRWQDAANRLQDPPDGSPAVRMLHPDGTVRGESHWQGGEVQDD